jgi:RNA polymerase primary sigma factor
MKMTKMPISLETPMDKEGVSRLAELIEDKEAASPHELTIRSHVARWIREVLSTLSNREERILRMRFGIGLDREYNFEETGQEFNVSKEKIRQIEAKALKRLRYFSKVRRKSFIEN